MSFHPIVKMIGVLPLVLAYNILYQNRYQSNLNFVRHIPTKGATGAVNAADFSVIMIPNCISRSKMMLYQTPKQVVKAPKAARTAGRCDLPGVTCDARLLSCHCPSPLNLPSGLPLPRDLPKPNEAKQSAARARKCAGRPGEPAQPPGVCVCPDTSAFGDENRSLPQSRTKGPTPRFTPSGVYHPAQGHTSPHRGRHRGFAGLNHSAQCGRTVIGRE